MNEGLSKIDNLEGQGSEDAEIFMTSLMDDPFSVHDEQEGEGQEAIGGHRAQAVEGSHPPKRKLIVKQQCKLKIQFIKLKQWGS